MPVPKKSPLSIVGDGPLSCSSVGSSKTLKITRFIGTSENSVRIQIAVALIAFLLLRLAQGAQKAVLSPTVFSRLIRANLLHRRAFNNLIDPPPIYQHPSR